MMKRIYAGATRRAAVMAVVALWASGAGGAVPQTSTSSSGASPLGVWDTGASTAEDLASLAASQPDRWTSIARGELPASFGGDVVLGNGRILAIWRKQGAAIDVYSLNDRGEGTRRAVIRPLAGDGQAAAQLVQARLVEHSRGGLRLETQYRTAAGAALSLAFRVKRGDIAIETQPGAGAGGLKVECSSRFVVLPDFFADDVLIDARRMPLDQTDLPSENMLLHLAGDQDAIAMCVFENSDQEVRISLAGEGQQRAVQASEIRFGDGGKIWLALLSGPSIWSQRMVAPQEADQVLSLDWNMPFVAQWRADFTRPDELTDSWELLLKDPKNENYVKPSWLGGQSEAIAPDRRRWTTVLGWFHYPCWTNEAGEGFIQPIKNRSLAFDGPLAVYPINRTEGTPPEMFTVVDVARNCLGVGPCEYILNVEGQKQDHLGRATCAARDALNAIYQSGQQRQKRVEIEQALDDALAFVTHIRSRIDAYVAFGRQLRPRIAQIKRQQPELAEFLDDMDQLAAQIDQRLEQRREKIHSPEFVAEMNADFRSQLLDYQGADVQQQLEQYTRALTQIGGNQDELVGECRWVVRALRQKAGLWVAKDPRCAQAAQEIRESAQVVLLKPARYEAARH